jgi:sec-independent protein translocase protein TatA
VVEGLFQPMHLIIILGIVLVVFGPGKLANVGGAMGKSIKEFRASTTDPQPNAPGTTVSVSMTPVGAGTTADLTEKVVASDPSNV